MEKVTLKIVTPPRSFRLAPQMIWKRNDRNENAHLNLIVANICIRSGSLRSLSIWLNVCVCVCVYAIDLKWSNWTEKGIFFSPAQNCDRLYYEIALVLRNSFHIHPFCLIVFALSTLWFLSKFTILEFIPFNYWWSWISTDLIFPMNPKCNQFLFYDFPFISNSISSCIFHLFTAQWKKVKSSLRK